MCKYMAMTSFSRIRFLLRNSILLKSVVIREAERCNALKSIFEGELLLPHHSKTLF